VTVGAVQHTELRKAGRVKKIPQKIGALGGKNRALLFLSCFSSIKIGRYLSEVLEKIFLINSLKFDLGAVLWKLLAEMLLRACLRDFHNLSLNKINEI
jgi:hypothetical protein